MLINNSRAETYSNCPRRYYWNYHHGGTGIVLREVDPNLAWGTIMHHLLALYYAELSWKDGLEPALYDGVPNFADLDPYDKHHWREQLNWAERMMSEYAKWAGKHDRFSVIELETEGRFQLGTVCWQCGADYGLDEVTECRTCGAAAHSLIYRTDMVVNERGAVFPIDHKTTSGIGDNYLTQWHYSPQMLLYTKGVRQQHPKADRYQMNFIKKSKRVGLMVDRQCKACRGGAKKRLTCAACNCTGKRAAPALKDPPFHREPPIVFDEQRLARAEISRIEACNAITRQEAEPIEEAPLDNWQMAPDQCFARGRCPYIDLCWNGDPNMWYSPAEDMLMRYKPRRDDYVTLAREEMT